MSETRITGDDVRQRFPQQDPECCDCSPGSECRVQSSNRFTVRLIKQLDADARCLADLEAENGRLDAKARRLAQTCERYLKAAGFATNKAGSTEDFVNQGEAFLAALRSDAAEWRALQAVIGHPMRAGGGNVVLYRDGTTQTWISGTSETIRGPLAKVLAKLDALAEARKPKAEPERWRVRDEHGDLWGRFHSPAEARRWMDDPGDYPRSAFSESAPVREVKNTAGDVLLLREGRPIPTEGGPWT